MTQPQAPAPSVGDEPATDWYHGITEKHFDIAVRRAVSAALTSQPPAVALVDERREPAVLRHALRFAEEIIKGQARYIDGPDMYIDAEHLAENLRAALSPSGAESLGVKEQSQEVHPVESSSGSLPLGITAERKA